MLAALTFPAFDPIAISIGPFAIRWYALAYIAGILLAWRYCRWLASRPPERLSARAIDDFVFWATIGIVIGGRLGYVLFYKPGYYLENPVEIVFLWRGGMSFHGGLLGVFIGDRCSSPAARTCRSPSSPTSSPRPRRSACSSGASPTSSTASCSAVPPMCPGAWSFPPAAPVLRHPSQLYESGLEGIALFLALFILVRFGGLALRRTGDRRVPGRLRAGAHHRRNVPRAGPAYRFLWPAASPWVRFCRCRCCWRE